MLLPIFIFFIRRLEKKLFHFEVMFRLGGGSTILHHFIIFDEFVEQQNFLTKIVFLAIFASNLVLAENREKMPYIGSSKKFVAPQNLKNWSKT